MKKTQWMLYMKRADFERAAARFSVSPVLIRIMINRGVQEEEIGRYLNGTVKDFYDPHLLKGMDAAAEILKKKIAEGKKIRVIGDYDIDGVCASYILITALKRAGANADYDIPDRIKDGYGINENIIRKAKEDGTDTILTCDNGIGAQKEIRYAKDEGMTVIVTDHHEIFRNDDGTQDLPPADAVIDPKQEGCRYPFREICGAFVAFKTAQVLYEEFGVPEKELEDLIPFAAIATVGDVVRLQDENRILVKEGLRRIPQTENAGLQELIQCCGLDPEKISAYHIGFVIGPCLNAGGRLESAKTALRMFLTGDRNKAAELAVHLKNLNDERKSITNEGLEEAEKQVEQKYGNEKVLVVYLKNCHESVAGIIAGKLREEYYRPSIVLTDSIGENYLKGSGRSIENYHMFRALDSVKDLLVRYGGHPMAAGLTLEKKNEGLLRDRLNEEAGLTEEDLTEKIWIDAALPFSYVTRELIRELSLLEPFGQGNEKPVFAQKNVRIESCRIFGKNRNVVKLSLVSEDQTPMPGVIFTDGDAFLEEMKGSSGGRNTALSAEKKCFDILYYPALDEYMGRDTLQVVIRGWKFH